MKFSKYCSNKNKFLFFTSELVCPKEENELKKGIAIIEKADLDDVIRPNPKPHFPVESEHLPGSGVVQEYAPPTSFKPLPVNKISSAERPQSVRPSNPPWLAAKSSTTIRVPKPSLAPTKETTTEKRD